MYHSYCLSAVKYFQKSSYCFLPVSRISYCSCTDCLAEQRKRHSLHEGKGHRLHLRGYCNRIVYFAEYPCLF